MILNHNLYREYPNLILSQKDIFFLNYLKDNYKEHTEIIKTKLPDGNVRIFSNYRNFYLRDSKSSYIDRELIKKISVLCKNTPNHSTIDYLYKRAHLAFIPESLPFHVDKRSCVLSIPIGNIKHPIHWIDENNNELGSYYYHCPVLINTVIKHGCPENDSERFLFQIGFNESFEEISNLLTREIIQ